MRSSSIIATLLFGIAAVNAAPVAQSTDVATVDDNVVSSFVVDNDTDAPVESTFDVDNSNSTDVTSTFDVSRVADAKTLTVQIVRDAPKKEVCPKTDNGKHGDYPEHSYTANQLEAAFKAGATYQAKDKQVGVNKYPHKFNNNEKLEFDCGADKMEFPIQTNGKTYDGGSTTDVPDRVIYEYAVKKDKLQVKFCGVIRHGPKTDFLNCSSK